MTDHEAATIDFEKAIEALQKPCPEGCVFVIHDKLGNPIPFSLDVQKIVDILEREFKVKTIINGKHPIMLVDSGYGTWIEDHGEIEKLLISAFGDLIGPGCLPVYNKTRRGEILYRLHLQTKTKPEAFDANPDIVNLENGLYNWRTNKFMPDRLVDGKPYLSRVQLPITYNSAATCPHIDQFFAIVLKPGDIPKVKEFIGNLVYREYKTRKAFILYGPSGTGKTWLIDLCRGFVGEENASSVSLQELVSDRFASSDLHLRLLNECGDIPATALKDTAIIKRLTGNKDSIRAQKKNKDAFDFINYAKLLFSANRIPKVESKDSGWYKRIEIVQMDHVLGEIELSKELLAAMYSPEERSGLFNVAMDALRQLDANGWQFTNGTDTETMAEKYETLSNPVEAFVESRLEWTDRGFATRTDVYAAYVEFCKDRHVAPKPQEEFAHELRKYAGWLKDTKPRDNRKVNGRSVLVWSKTHLKARA